MTCSEICAACIAARPAENRFPRRVVPRGHIRDQPRRRPRRGRGIKIEHLAHIGRQILYSLDDAQMAFIGAVAQPDHPFTHVADVASAFLIALTAILRP